MKEGKPRRHPLVFCAFILALVVFILPTHTDLMFSAITTRGPGGIAVVTLICFGVVLLPLIVGLLLTRRSPDRWTKSKLATATWVILGLALVSDCFVWRTLIHREEPVNQASQETSPRAAPER